MVLQLGIDTQRSIHDRQMRVHPSDCILRLQWTHIDSITIMIHEAIATGPAVPIASAAAEISTRRIHKCPDCDFHTPHAANFKRHCTQIHGKPHLRIFTPCSTFSSPHLPQCPCCHATFATWRTYQVHVETRVCTTRQPADTLPSRPTMMPEPACFRLDPEGHRLKELLTQTAWQTIVAEPSLIDSLRHTCGLCGKWVGRVQELTMHMQKHHPTETLFMHQTAAQLMAVISPRSPCALCDTQWSHQHTCPRALQLAALLLQVRPDTSSRCLLCPADLDSPDDLVVHLRHQHNLNVSPWVWERDSLNGDPVCRHCLQQFSAMPGLRLHVTMNRCPSFDHLAEPQQPSPPEALVDALAKGTLYDYLDEETRFTMTHNCILCGRAFQRQNDLSAHLTQDHSKLHQDSLKYLTLLMEHLQVQAGCVCHPIVTRSHSHVCPALVQAAMTHEHHRRNHLDLTGEDASKSAGLLVPGVFPAAQPNWLPGATRDVKARILQHLNDRMFARLWENTDLCSWMSHNCLFCQADDMMPPELQLHLVQAHSVEFPGFRHFVQQLADAMWITNESSYQCDYCGMTFCRPDSTWTQATDRAQEHFLFQCPISFQVAFTLCTASYDGGLVNADSGCGASGFIWRVGAGDSPIRRKRPIQETSQQNRGRRRPRHAGHTSGDGSNAPNHRGDHHAARRSSQQLEVSRFLCAVPKSGPAISLPNVTGCRNTMEATEGQHGSDHVTAVSSDESPPAAAGAAPDPPVPAQGAATVDSLGEQRLPSTNGQLALSEMESGQEAAGTTPFTAGTESAADARSDLGNEGLHRGAGVHPTIQRPHQAHGGDEGGAMEDSMPSSNERHAQPPHQAESQLGMVSGGRPVEDSLPNTVSTGEGTASFPLATEGQIQRQGQRQRIPDGPELPDEECLILQLALRNTGNVCYINSTVLSYLWMTLHSVDPPEFWGHFATGLESLLRTAPEGPVTLEDLSWFQPTLQQWGDIHQQGDVGEFVSFFLDHMQPQCVNSPWEKRRMTDTVVQTLEAGTPLSVITLPFADTQTDLPQVPLQFLVTNWHDGEGLTAYTQWPHFVCLHVDRFQETPTGRTRVRTSIDVSGVTYLPKFAGLDSLDVVWHGYITLAVICHMGDDQAGHCRAALSMQPGNMWWLCEDGTTPHVARFSRSMGSFIKVVWMCDVDHYLDLNVGRYNGQPPLDDAALVQMVSTFATTDECSG
eukprot:Skav210421  [mRNA]  locus=scaffold1573:321634:325260:+ [translate_table: standard]